MSAIPPGPDAGGETNRVRCAYCGGNNFPASAACWQCGRPLQPLRSGAAGTSSAYPEPASGAWQPPSAALPGARPMPGIRPTLAPKAAAALGLLFPWAGLPIGLAFLMLGDADKVRLGWATIGWSVVGTILNTIGFLLPFAFIWPAIKALLSHPPSGAAGGGVPSLPPVGGGDEILSFAQRCGLFQQP